MGSLLVFVVNGLASASGQSSQTIDFPAIADKTFGDPDFELFATASSGLPVEFDIESGRATISGTTLTITGGGTVIVQAKQPGNEAFAPAIPEQRIFKVNRLPIPVSLTDLEHVYDGTPKSATEITDPPGASTVLTYNFTTIPPTSGGTHAVVATVVDFKNSGSISGTMTIARATQEITFAPLSDLPSGSPATPLSATASSGLPVQFEVTSGNASIGGTIWAPTVTPTEAGTVTIVAMQAGTDDWLPASEITQSFIVSGAALTITFPGIATKTYDDAPFVPFASASSGLPIEFQIIAGPATLS